MKKLLSIIVVLLLALVLVGCNEESTETYYTQADVDALIEQKINEFGEELEHENQLKIDDLQAQIVEAYERIVELEESRLTYSEFTEAEKLQVLQWFYNVLRDELTEAELISFVDEVLDENGFYDEYNEQVYAYIDSYWQELLIAFITEIESQTP